MILGLAFVIAFMQLPVDGISACDAAKSNHNRTAPLTLEEVCRLETRMSLLKDGTSWSSAMKTLRIRGKDLRITAHGAMTYRHLGGGYTLATPFYSNGTAYRLLLLDGQARVVKDIQWH